MCKKKDILLSGLQDLKTQKKKNRISMMLMFLSLIIYIGVNSTVDSINRNVHDVLNCLEARIATTTESAEDTENVLDTLKEKYGDDKRIKDIFISTDDTSVEWVNVQDILFVDSQQINFDCFNTQVLEYGYNGERKAPDMDEVIIPKYLYDVGVYDLYTYADGDKLIGETLEFEYKTYYGDYSEKYRLKVIGTYDNIKARRVDCHFYVNGAISIGINDLNYLEKKGREEEYRKEIEELFGEGAGEEYTTEKYGHVSVYVSENYDMDEMIQEIAKETGIVLMKNVILDEELQGYFQYVVVVGNTVSFMLLIIAMINIIISSISEAKSRKWEFALKMSMGYTKKDVISVFLVEKLANMLRAVLLSLFVLVIYSIIITYAYQNLFEYWKKSYTIILNIENIAIAMGLAVLAGLAGVLAGRIFIREINVAETLKAGE